MKTGKGIDWSGGRDRRAQSPLLFFWTEQGFSPQRVIAFLLGGLSILLPLYIMFQLLFGSGETYTLRAVVVTMLLLWTFLYHPLKRKSWKDKLDGLFVVDVICALAAVAVQIYIFVHIERFTYSGMDVTAGDKIAAIIAIILVLEGCRRTMGYAIGLVGLFFLSHAVFANHFPGFLYGAPSTLQQVTENLFMGHGGIYGIAMGVMVEVMFVFIFFGAFLHDTSIGSFFISFANAIAGRRVGGPAKVAIVSSALIGTVTGSVVANVVTTGSITIPMMKRLGYKPEFAGAVEAVASSGGQLMPPMMGVTAFLIAAFLGMPYATVCKHALIPSLLYYFSVYLMVHFRARKEGLKTLDEESIPDIILVIKQGSYLVVPLVLIIGLLLIGYSATYAALVAMASLFLLSFVRKETRLSPEGWVLSLEEAARISAPIGMGCAAIGIIIGALGISGVGFKFTSMVVEFSGGQLWIGLIFAMVAAIILGMGVPTSLVYIFLVILVIPGLVKMGINEVAAHLFAFYFGVIGNITPPVALAAFAAAAIAGSDYFRTGIVAAKLGIAAFIVPFMFVYFPELLLIGDPINIAVALATSVMGIICLASAVEGWLMGTLGYLGRILQFIAAIALIKPGIYSDLAGMALFAAVAAFQFYKGKSRPSVATESASYGKSIK